MQDDKEGGLKTEKETILDVQLIDQKGRVKLSPAVRKILKVTENKKEVVIWAIEDQKSLCVSKSCPNMSISRSSTGNIPTGT